MQVIINSLELQNFQGFKSFKIPPGIGTIVITGGNATGKTTVANAISWLLTDKNISGDSDFEIKTLKKDGEPIHNLNHSVVAGLIIDMKKVTLKKLLKEKWTKQRGSPKKAFTGHATDYYINEVPVKKGEWDDYIAQIVSEGNFRVLSNPRYFNENLHWKERRKMLLELGGEVTDEEILTSDNTLTRPDILDEHIHDDALKLLKGKLKEINRNLEEIPARIDELTNAQEEVKKVDLTGISVLELEKKSIYEKLDAPVDDGSQKVHILVNKRDSIFYQIKELERKNNEAYAGTQTLGERAEIFRKKVEEHKKTWDGIKNKKMEFTPESICYSCRQTLPEDQVNEALVRATEEFETDKKNHYDVIKADIEYHKRMIEEVSKQIGVLNENITANNKSIQDLKAQHEFAVEDIITAEKEKGDIAGLDRESLKSRIRQIDDKRTDIISKNREYVHQENMRKRIKELGESELKLSAEYETIEGTIDHLNRYGVAKVNLLNQKISAKFKLAKFKMFELQINGGINDQICETLYDGVPYSSTLNNGMRINVGLDIINTFSKFYNVNVPVIVDNAESVDELIETESQLIKLVVDKKKPIKVEREPK
ncbi:MAG TPA: hypothetical protein ENH82_07705 [bacterium]|nr:hypothetical protein [bacterium]